MRRVLKWLHLWTGLSIGLVFAMLGLTGTLLAYQPELLAARSEFAGLEQETRADAKVLTLLQADSRGVSSAEPPRPGLPVWQAYAKDGLRLYLHPGDGRVLLERSTRSDAVLWLRDLHVHLLAGKQGEAVLGICGIGMLFLLLSGVYLWWPRPGAWLESLRWHAQPPLRRWLSWHRSLGALTLPLLLLLAGTGTLMVYDGFSRASLGWLFGSSGAVKAPPPLKPEPGRAIDWDAVMAAAQAALPEAQLRRISLPRADNALISVRARMPGEWHPVGRSTVWLDPYQAKVLAVMDATRQGAGTRANYAVYPLHMGGGLGEGYRTLIALGGLVPAVLLVTGFLFWRRRTRRGGESSAGD
ncbi:PepSY-associated TM helix domain-containing protein [Tahibacter harae]|uniref:PepSY domain-containing protein n=1 Tax=Tahibacter harae TaxID=2963937 RepID=A0ABT1QU34_9GAMM|nr:PepSY-associated TM helix domain-containing protein [Tahibacter harae]MCQ4165782.1 PepSY domain-containing protein [Tahibacter harae]